MTDQPWLVVGLGNPGDRYAANRHNLGHMVLDVLAGRAAATFARHPRAQAAVAEARLGTLPGGRPGPRVVLAKPSTYMNVSGGPVSGLAKYYGVDPDHVLVVHDEVDIPFGAVKLKVGGGVGRPPGRMDTADFVLKNFSGAEAKELPFLLDDAADAVEMVLTEGLLAAQGKFHTKV